MVSSRSPLVASIIVSAMILASRLAAADPGAEAQVLFDQGLKNMAAHDLERACRDFEASLAKLDDSATRFQLAACQAERGKVALAWRLLREVADTPTLSQ